LGQPGSCVARLDAASVLEINPSLVDVVDDSVTALPPEFVQQPPGGDPRIVPNNAIDQFL
jgi:hypothetical protein